MTVIRRIMYVFTIKQIFQNGLNPKSCTVFFADVVNREYQLINQVYNFKGVTVHKLLIDTYPVKQPKGESSKKGKKKCDGTEKEDSRHCCWRSLPKDSPHCPKQGHQFYCKCQQKGVTLGTTLPCIGNGPGARKSDSVTNHHNNWAGGGDYNYSGSYHRADIPLTPSQVV